MRYFRTVLTLTVLLVKPTTGRTKDFPPTRGATTRAPATENAPQYATVSLDSGPAGLIMIEKEGVKLFYKYVMNAAQKTDAPILWWICGELACPSSKGLFHPCGPYQTVDGVNVEVNPNSYHHHMDLLFVDIVPGEGYSQKNLTSSVKTTPKLLRHRVLSFFRIFAEMHSEFGRKKLYIHTSGLSGFAVLEISKALLDAQRENASFPMPLAGVILDNALVSPADYYSSVPIFALQNGVINATAVRMMAPYIDACKQYLYEAMYPLYKLTTREEMALKAYFFCEKLSVQPIISSQKFFNGHNIRIPNKRTLMEIIGPSLVHIYFNDRASQLELGFDERVSWTDSRALYGPNYWWYMMGMNQGPVVSFLLNQGVDVMVMSGDNNLIYNHIGTEYWIGNLTWIGADAWKNTMDEKWTLNGETVGTIRQLDGGDGVGQLLYVKVDECGSPVADFKPKVALELVNRFANGIFSK